MAKLIGYIVAVIGLVILGLSFIASSIPLISAVPKMYVMFAGIIAIIIGIALSMSSGKGSQSEEEVPIYEGTGKKRKIVGYRREK